VKTYFSDIIPRIERYSQELDNLTLLTNQHWVVIDDINKTKIVYIFRQNKELIISQNGRVEKAKWEYLDHNSLLIDRKDESYLFKQGFFDENILALKIDGTEEYAFFVNETKYNKDVNSLIGVIEFLNQKYIQAPIIVSSENIKPSNNVPQYVAPKYTSEENGQSYSFCFGRDTTEYNIEFEDGEKGKISVIQNDKKAFYLDKKSRGFPPSKALYYYENVEFCIHALHYYLKTGKILKEGFIDTYL